MVTCKIVFTIALTLFLAINGEANRAQPRPFYDPELFFKKTDQKLYSSWISPNYGNENPFPVNISFKLIHFSTVNEQKSEFSMLINIDFSWIDQRLIYPNVDHRINRSEIIPLELNQWHLSRIWRPSVYFSNANSPDKNLLADQNIGMAIGTLNADGEIRVVKRAILDAACKQDLTFFPFDIQQCSIQLESTSLSGQTLELNWQEPNALQMPKKFSWGSFRLLEYAIHSNYKSGDGPNSINSSQLEAIFQLRRQPNYLWLELYIPSTLFVISSWTAFWVDIPAAPARVALVLTPMLTHVTATKAFHDKMPRVSYIHSLDVWVIMCTLFIFAAVVEYSTVNYYFHKPARTKEAKQAKVVPNSNNDTMSVATEIPATTPKRSKSEMVCDFSKKKFANLRKGWNKSLSVVIPSYNASKISPKRMALNIDRTSRFFFPFLFFTFNLLYWTILIGMSP